MQPVHYITFSLLEKNRKWKNKNSGSASQAQTNNKDNNKDKVTGKHIIVDRV